ncbi:MAG: hypothetical protein Tsb002_35980 [Wenzhouxiangellaceae bacterium]
MSAHAIPHHAENECIVSHGQLPTIRSTWQLQADKGALKVDMLLDDRRIITENCADIGASERGINDALYNFSVNSFHVMLAAARVRKRHRHRTTQRRHYLVPLLLLRPDRKTSARSPPLGTGLTALKSPSWSKCRGYYSAWIFNSQKDPQP